MPVALDPRPYPLDHLTQYGDEDAVALILRDKVLSWGDLRSRVASLAAWLAQHIPEQGARVASWAAKNELTCLMPLAAARAGLVHVPVNPLLKRAQVAHILEDCEASMLLGNAARLRTLEPQDMPAGCRVLEDMSALAQAEQSTDGLPASQFDPGALAAIMYTSGSTGKPKGVMLSHANLWLGAVSVAHYLGLDKGDRTLAVLPLSFDYGQSQLLSTWRAGGCVIPVDYLTPRDVIKACEQHAITTLAAVPPLWVQLVEHEWPAAAKAGLRRMTNSGGALTTELVKDLRAMAPQADLYPMYGLTEAFRSTYLDPALVGRHPTSMGTAIPFAEILLLNGQGECCEEGELVHCGPLVAQGYWRDPERSAQRFRPAPSSSQYGGIAVYSGDQVRRDKNGLLYFVGREDAMIKSAGNRISPTEIEEAVLATGLVDEAVAFGVADTRLGQTIHLVVRGDALEEDLRKRLQRDLPNFMQPHTIRFAEAMPLNANGKIDRGLMRRSAEEHSRSSQGAP